MKKIILFLMVLLTLVGCNGNEKIEIKSAVTLNSTKADMSEYVFFEDKDHVFESVGAIESSRMFDEGGTGILYYGSPGCIYCNRIVGALNDVAKELGVVVYSVELAGTTNEEQQKIIEVVLNNLGSILNKDNNGNPILYVPEVVIVKDGKIIDHHLSVVDSYKDANKDLTKEQYEELKGIYKALIKKLQ